MVEQENPYFESSTAPTPSGPKLRRVSKMALAGGLVAGLAMGGTGLGFAFASAGTAPSVSANTASGSTPPATPPKGGPGRVGRMGRMAFGPGGGIGMGALGGAIYGTFTTKSGSGYKTEEFQVGTAGSVSSDSITVTSANGHSATYAVVPSTVVNSQSQGIGSVSKGDQVRVIATTVNGKDTATDIVDTSKLRKSRGFFGFGSAKPSPSGTAPTPG
jgi:hypothetical protein